MPYRPTEKTEARRARHARAHRRRRDRPARRRRLRVRVRAGGRRPSRHRHRHRLPAFPLQIGAFRRGLQARLGARARGRDAAGVADDGRPARERLAAAAEAFARRALAEPDARLRAAGRARRPRRRGRAAHLPARLPRGRSPRRSSRASRRGELPPQDAHTVAAALVGALGEALVGPLVPGRPREPRGADRHACPVLHERHPRNRENRGRPDMSVTETTEPHPRGLQPAAAAARLQPLPREPPARRGRPPRGRRLGRGAARRASARRPAASRSSGAASRTRTRRCCTRTTATATASTRSSSTPRGTG